MSDSGTVYIVDDDEAVRDSISFLLDSVDMPYRTYASADEFLEQLADDAHGALVLDIRMPGMSGLELQQRVVQPRATRSRRIVSPGLDAEALQSVPRVGGDARGLQLGLHFDDVAFECGHLVGRRVVPEFDALALGMGGQG